MYKFLRMNINGIIGKKVFVMALLSLIFVKVNGQWRPQDCMLSTSWTSEVSSENCLKEYPRPILQRTEWKNLNGLWKYAIRKHGDVFMGNPDGTILVPFAIESCLSGVKKTVGRYNDLWYQRTFIVPEKWNGKHILLHFGAVDWMTDVFVNDIKVGSHKGGYTEFSFDITPYLNKRGEQKVELKVWDPTNDGYQPVGKQNTKPEGIWYTSVTGIWQTVWIEPVEEQYVTAINTTSDIDAGRLNVSVMTKEQYGIIEVTMMDDGKILDTKKVAASQTVTFCPSSPHLWSHEDPYLYDIRIRVLVDGKTIDDVTSYAAMRKISTKRDSHGIMRIQLNNKDIFQFGPLDQGYWPDGLYTAPTDEALKYDIEQARDLGFNMIRKHMKVEPARWYTWCDRFGMLVWQDMPSGDKSPQWQPMQYFDGTEAVHTTVSEENFQKEWKEIMDALQPYPSIVVWTPFNEAWGQFNSKAIATWTKNNDTTRLVDPASGGNHYQTGDMLDIHHYPEPNIFMYDGSRPTVLGEYGGLGLPVKNHLWQNKKNWGYVEFKNTREITDRYVLYTKQLVDMVKNGLSAAVYTQATDVEGEVNGLMTYDRKLMKVDKDRVKKANDAVCKSLYYNK